MNEDHIRAMLDYVIEGKPCYKDITLAYYNLDFIAEAEKKLAEEIKSTLDVGYFLKNIREEDDEEGGTVETSWMVRGLVDSDGYLPLIIEAFELADNEKEARLACWYKMFCWWNEQKQKEGE